MEATFASGVLSGAVGGVGEKIGGEIMSGKFNPIYPSPLKTYGEEGGIIGDIGGEAIGEYLFGE